ncbi:hypothetical protein [Xanthocytophaga flava]|uniref:hypothetical protein n=1 Tax=Xanthocytophaga flava TaxID=3048013 RepID=UPI0028D424BA|nr:hypothetical protein [Xanthocytophaga flavus]MDJ1472372.1 hypothetical protein [Xanthocytophaga flavus]
MKTYSITQKLFLIVLSVVTTLSSSCQKENEVIPQLPPPEKGAKLNLILPTLPTAHISSIYNGDYGIEFLYRRGSSVPNSAIIKGYKNGVNEHYRGITTDHWSFGYDADLHLTKVTGEDGTVFQVSTNTDGAITQAICYVNGAVRTTHTLSYNASGQLINLNQLFVGMNGVSDSKEQYVFTYQPDGNLNTLTCTNTIAASSYAIQATGHDSSRSPWLTTHANTIFWWMETVFGHLVYTPGQLLSYKNNVTSYVYTRPSLNPKNLNVNYSYENTYPALLVCSDPLVWNNFRFTYFYQ